MHADLKFSAEFDLSGSGTVGLDIDCDLTQLDAVDQLLVWDLLNRALSVSAPLLSADANGLVDADRPPGPGELTTATASSGGGGQAQPESADTPTATPAPAASTPTASSSAGYKCTDCQRSFKTYGGLRVHQGRVHAAAATEPGGGVASEPTVDQPDAPTPSGPDAEPVPLLECDMCPKTFRTERLLRSHVANTHGSRSERPSASR